jgi:hypothetical protein
MMLPRDCVEERIERLKQPSAGAHGWKLVVDDFDANELCPATDIFNIQMKSKYMSISLRFALVEMNAWKWQDCCDEAVKELNRLEGHQYITSGKTVMNWHHAFRNHNESFILSMRRVRDATMSMVMKNLIQRHTERSL